MVLDAATASDSAERRVEKAGAAAPPVDAQRDRFIATFTQRLAVGARVYLTLYGLDELLPNPQTELSPYFVEAINKALSAPDATKAITSNAPFERHPLLHPVLHELTDVFMRVANQHVTSENYFGALQYIFLVSRCVEITNGEVPPGMPAACEKILALDPNKSPEFQQLASAARRLIRRRMRQAPAVLTVDLGAADDSPFSDPDSIRETYPKDFADADVADLKRYPDGVLRRYVAAQKRLARWEDVVTVHRALVEKFSQDSPGKVNLASSLESCADQTERIGLLTEAKVFYTEALEIRNNLPRPKTGRRPPYNVAHNEQQRRKIEQKISAIERNEAFIATGRVWFDPPEIKRQAEDLPERFEDFDVADLEGGPVDYLVRYAEQARMRNEWEVMVQFQERICSLRPHVFKNWWALAQAYSLLRDLDNELRMRFVIATFTPEDTGNTDIAHRLIASLGDPGRMRRAREILHSILEGSVLAPGLQPPPPRANIDTSGASAFFTSLLAEAVNWQQFAGTDEDVREIPRIERADLVRNLAAFANALRDAGMRQTTHGAFLGNLGNLIGLVQQNLINVRKLRNLIDALPPKFATITL